MAHILLSSFTELYAVGFVSEGCNNDLVNVSTF